jgi:hypothetical protein
MRVRDIDDIRRDAVIMAANKLTAGCVECAKRYVNLARDHGAKDTDFDDSVRRMIIKDMPRSIGQVMRQSKVLAPATGAILGSTVRTVLADDQLMKEKVARIKNHQVPAPRHRKTVDPFGVDGSTSLSSATQLGMPLNFYIGELGYGLCGNCGPCNGACFRTDCANYVGGYYTYAYWGLEGPNSPDKGSMANYQFGVAQADAFISAWGTGPYATYVFGQTFFCDVEAGFGGWSDYNYGPNQDVLQGFVDEIYDQGQYWSLYFNPGVYINVNDYNGPNHHYFSSGWGPGQPVVLWVTGDQTSVPCAPCATNCNTLTDVQNRWNNTIRHVCQFGNGAQLWQYWVGSCGCGGDFDYSPQSGNTNFTSGSCV